MRVLLCRLCQHDIAKQEVVVCFCECHNIKHKECAIDSLQLERDSNFQISFSPSWHSGHLCMCDLETLPPQKEVSLEDMLQEIFHG